MTKRISIKFLALAVFCLLLSIGQIFAQSTVTGGINGTVTDPQGAVVPNATVTVTNLGTNSVVTTTTDSDGGFRVTNLQPGTYSVEITATGFSASKAEKIVVEVGQSTPVNAALGVAGAGTTTIDVTAEAPVINTNDNANAQNINQTSINELPINGRRWSNFALLTPGAVPDGTFGLISFRGISGLLNNNTIDGGDNNQAFFSEERGRTRINYVISQASIREFQVNTSNYSAEYGRSAGGVVNAVTKSGTNEFHGELFYYNRNNRNGARNPRAFNTVLVNGVATSVAAKPIDLRQQFGGAIGGPIMKDRLFFFFSYDQQKRNFPGLAVINDPGYLNSANIPLLTTPLGQQVVGAAPGTLGRGLTLAQINSTINFLASLTGETPRKGDQKLFFPKIDWQVNDNNLFSISYNRLRWKSPAGVQTQAVNTLGRRSFGDDFVEVDSINARLQSTLSANMLNEFRFQYGRDNEFQFSQSPLAGEPTSATTSQGPRSPNVSLQYNGNTVFSFGTPTFLERARYPDEKRYQFADTFTYISGRHTLKFGGDFNRVTDDTSNLRSEAGSYLYSNLSDFIVDYLNFQTPFAANTVVCPSLPSTNPPSSTSRFAGRCYSGNLQQGYGTQGLKFTTTEYNIFFQDDFRLTSRLTFNIGVRYEYQKMPGIVYPNTNTAYSNVVIPNSNLTFARATSQLPNDKDNIGPRLGFAYDLMGDGKTSIRAGAGIYYGRIPNSTIYNALLNTGNPSGQFQINTPVSTTSPIFPAVPTPSTATITNATTPPGAIQYYAPGYQAPMIYQYDFIIERQLFKNTVVSASYIGSIGRDLPTFIDHNFNPVPSPANIITYTIAGGIFNGQTATIPRYTRVFGSQAITEIQSSVKSKYNAFVFQFNRRFTDGLQVQASYTVAKATDTNQNSATFTQNNSPLDVFNRSYDDGPSNLDVRHKFVVSAVYAPNPYKGDKKTFYNYLLNGWSIAPIYVFYSGRPYDATVQSATGGGTSLNGTSGDQRFPLFSRNAFRLPNISNLDVRLSKRFNITESVRFEVLGEVFNAFNRTHVFGVNTGYYRLSSVAAPCTINGSTSSTNLCFSQGFGQVLTTDSTNYRERQIQFSARLQF